MREIYREKRLGGDGERERIGGFGECALRLASYSSLSSLSLSLSLFLSLVLSLDE